MIYRYFPVGAYGANCCLVSDADGNTVVMDPGDEAERILAHIRDFSLTVRAVLLTHAHFDHMGAAARLQREFGAPLYVHTDDVRGLTDSRYSVMPLSDAPTADRLLKDGDTVTVGSLTFTVLHTPGHTPGSVCYRLENVLFAGDTLFAGSIGRTDFPGGDMTAMRQSLRRLSALPDELSVVPGHGEETTIGYEKQTNPFMIGL